MSRAGGCADDAALDEIKELCLGALRAVNDPVCGGRLLTIHCCAAALYSDSAHRHWDCDGTSGIDRLRQRIFRALNSYQRRLYRLEISSEYKTAWTGAELAVPAGAPATPPVS